MWMLKPLCATSTEEWHAHERRTVDGVVSMDEIREFGRPDNSEFLPGDGDMGIPCS